MASKAVKKKGRIVTALLTAVTTAVGVVSFALPGKMIEARGDEAGEIFNITLPTEQVGYVLTSKTAGQTTVETGGSYTFIFKLLDDYSQSTPKITYGEGKEITLVGTEYTITQVRTDIVLRVENVVLNKYMVTIPDENEQKQNGYELTANTEGMVEVNTTLELEFTLEGVNNAKTKYKLYENGAEIQELTDGDKYEVEVKKNLEYRVECIAPTLVTYNLNGGLGTLNGAKTYYAQGEEIGIQFPSDIRRDGYEFLGWSENKNSTNPEYKEKGGATKLTADAEQVTLYAIWKAVGKEEAPAEEDWFDTWVYLVIVGVVVLVVLTTVSIYYNKRKKALAGRNGNKKASSGAKAVKEDKKEDRE